MSKDSMIFLAKEWFVKGGHDIFESKLSLKHGGWTDIICFHCQQAAEKYLKGFLVSQGINVGMLRKWQIHELPKLWKECYKIENKFEAIEEECIILNRYYIEPRYPLLEPRDYTKEEARRAINSAERVINFINNLVFQKGN